jgi:hypothetical protein
VNKVSIGFSRPKSWKPFAKAIMLVEGTNYSHVFVTWRCTNIKRRKVFEAIGSGIRILSNVVFKQKAEIVELYHFYVSDEVLFEIEQAAHDMSGRPYGYKAILGLTIMRAFNLFNRVFGIKGRQGNPFKDGEYSQVCVEIGGFVIKKIMKELPYDFEDFGLPEFQELAAKHGEKVDQSVIDRINASKKK